MAPPIIPIADRLFAATDRSGSCWNWTRCVSDDGYPVSWLNGRKRNAATLMFELMVSPIPAGMQLDHTCRNPRCVNPAHLEPVTPTENLRRRVFVSERMRRHRRQSQ